MQGFAVKLNRLIPLIYPIEQLHWERGRGKGEERERERGKGEGEKRERRGGG
jgi:hypothetical protein